MTEREREMTLGRNELVFRLDRAPTPLGDMLLVVDDDDRLRAADFWDYESRMRRLLRVHYDRWVTLRCGTAPADIRERLQAYFGGELAAIDGVRIETRGTEFQRAVWATLRRVPAGQTVTYGELAVRLGRPRAVRAIGHANGANPIGVIVPCHRVVGAKNQLTGYGGGLPRKRWLLMHEGALPALPQREPEPGGADGSP